jgi:hypothetical protein
MSPREEERAPYLSRSQGAGLELKSAEAVGEARILPRAVCGFLNGSGGEIIVGVREVGGAKVPDAVEDPGGASRVVLDRLASSIEPSIPAGLEVEDLSDRHGGWLRIRVPKGKALYAVRERHGGFAVLRRVGDRQVPLGWLEIQERLIGGRGEVRGSRGGAAQDGADARRGLEGWRDRVEKRARTLRETGGLLLWMEASTPATGTDEHAWQEKVGGWIADPTTLGVRRLGWHYGTLEGRLTRVQGAGPRRWFGSGDAGAAYRWTEVSPSGALRFATALDHIDEGGPDPSGGSGRRLDPWAFIETVASCAALFAKVLEASGVEAGRVRAALALTRIQGWSLRPGRPGTLEYQIQAPAWQAPYPEDLLQATVGGLPVGEIRRAPHRLAWMLVREVYASFGYEEGAIPLHDAARGTFVFA